MPDKSEAYQKIVLFNSHRIVDGYQRKALPFSAIEETSVTVDTGVVLWSSEAAFVSGICAVVVPSVSADAEAVISERPVRRAPT